MIHPHGVGSWWLRSPGATAKARRWLLVGGLVLAVWILFSDWRAGYLQTVPVLLGVTAVLAAVAALARRVAWLGVCAIFMIGAAVPWDTSAAAFVLILLAVFDTGASRPAWLGLSVLGGGLIGLVLDWVVGSQDLAATVAFSFVLISVSTVASLLRTQAERGEAAEELSRLRRSSERVALARAMHDVVAAPMSHVVLISTDLLCADDIPGRVREGIRIVQAEARESLGELRTMLGFLRTDTDPPGTSPDAVRSEWRASLERLHTRGFTTDAHLDLDLPADQPERAELLRLAIRELTTNVLRHSSPPATVRMTLVATPGTTSMAIANPLTTPPHGQLPPSGLGLQGLSEQAEACGGQLVTTLIDDEWLAMLSLDPPVRR